MNIAIVDDCTADRALLRAHVKKYALEHNLLVSFSEYSSGAEFLSRTASPDFDAVFLDIYMGSMNGMAVAEKMRESDPCRRIIFVSSSSDFAVQSYAVHAFYYLLKPISYSDIANVMKLLVAAIGKSSRFISVKEGREIRRVMVSDILYADYHNHYVLLHTSEAIISTYMKFPQMEEMLSIYPEFLTCFRCISINMDKIKKVDDRFFLLCNGEYIPINRPRLKEIKSLYSDYIFALY